MENWQKGEIAELRFQLRASEKGIAISKPTTPQSYDAIIEDDNKLLKIQVKWGGLEPTNAEGAIEVDLRKQRRLNRGEHYSIADCDLLMVYIPQIDTVCAFGPDIFSDRRSLSVRYRPPKNGQRKGVILAEDHVW